jgi:hypothetical protein
MSRPLNFLHLTTICYLIVFVAMQFIYVWVNNFLVSTTIV